MKYTMIVATIFLLAGCIQIDKQIVTRADSQHISEISDGVYCGFTNQELLDDLELMESYCRRIEWSPSNKYYYTGDDMFYAMRISPGVVLAQKIPDTSGLTEMRDLVLIRVTKDAYTHIDLAEAPSSLAAHHGFGLITSDSGYGVTHRIVSGSRDEILDFFRDLAKGIELNGEPVSTIDPHPNFHMKMAGDVFQGGKPHPIVTAKAAELTRPFPKQSVPVPAAGAAPKSSPVASSDVEALDEILTVLRTANVRSKPTAQSEKVGRLKAGIEIDVTGRTMVDGQQWYRIDLDGQDAFVIGYLLSPSSAPPASAPSTYAAPSANNPPSNATAPAQPVEPELQPGSAFRDCDDCPEMVVIPAGQFRMGDLNGQGEKYELPVHQVTLQKDFGVGKYEVTRDQYAAFVSATGHETVNGCARNFYLISEQDAEVNWQKPGFDQTGRDPVTCVLWDDAKAYAAWLSNKTGQPYRLLSESEWEYAARAGTDTLYSHGNQKRDLCMYGNGADNSFVDQDVRNTECSDGFSENTAPVGSFQANSFGLHDMHGNVGEWLEDCWVESYEGAPADGSARSKEQCNRRVIRGGSWWDSPQELRSAFRTTTYTDNSGHEIGFRVARTLDQASQQPSNDEPVDIDELLDGMFWPF